MLVRSTTYLHLRRRLAWLSGSASYSISLRANSTRSALSIGI
jgi:hypothetical protein